MQIDITLVFFVYGLAFFSMGVVMLLEAGRYPRFTEARVLLPLAVFGLVHGIHEWVEMFLDKSEWLELQYPTQIAWMRIGILIISFTSLLFFSIRSLHPQERTTQRDYIIVSGVLALYLAIIILATVSNYEKHSDWLLHVDALSRYLLAVPAASLAALAFYRQASQNNKTGRKKLALSLGLVAIAFAIYAFTQTVVASSDLFPADVWNSVTFAQLTGFPVQVLRAAMAIVITLSLIRAIQLVENERQQQFRSAQRARVEALEQVSIELEARESMRKELMRHTVVAQEDERSRIARELHDETSQLLAAFSLHLESLRHIQSDENDLNSRVEYLQALRKKMSEGIYRLINDLRPAQLDDLGLIAAIKYLADEEFKRNGTRIQIHTSGNKGRLDPLVETALFRVAQEALTNVVRHAQVDHAQIDLVYNQERVTLRVIDEGCGFEVDEEHRPPHGWGLAGMRERVDAVDGELNIRSAPGAGTVVEAIVPVEKIEQNTHENGDV